MLSLAARHKYNLEISLNGILTKLALLTGVQPRGAMDAGSPWNSLELPQKRNKGGWAMAGLWGMRKKGM